MISTLVIGASSNPEQYSHMAIVRLMAAGHPVAAIGRTPFIVGSTQVTDQKKSFPSIHTVTLYLNKDRQRDYEQYILDLQPQRIIFNPGAENPDFLHLAQSKGIDAIEACTLVMLAAGTY
jgi:predicted CoA-binding protein